MKKLMIKLSFILFLGINVFAMQSNNVKEAMDQKIHQALYILKNKKETNKQKAHQIFKIFDEVFDYNLMARLSLGGYYWRELDKNQKKKYITEFIRLLKESFIEKLKLYNNQDIILKDFKKTRKNRAELITFIVGKKDKINVTYKFYRSKKRGWIIYDVLVSGVSIIQSYRKQFSDLLQNYNFEKFLQKLNQKDTQSN